MRRWLLVAACGLLLASGCTGDDPSDASVNPDETAPSTTLAPITAAPTTAALGENVKTVEAAQRLLDLFAHLDGEAARMLMAKGAPDAEFDQALQAVYVGQELDLARARFQREAGRRFAGYARPQLDVIFRAEQIVDARRDDCVVVKGTADLRPRYTNPVPVVTGILGLIAQVGISPSGGNPTAWRLFVVGEAEAGTDLQAICPAP